MIDLVCQLFGVTMDSYNQQYIYYAAIILTVMFFGVILKSLFAFLINIFR